MTTTPGSVIACYYCEEQIDRWRTHGRYLRAVGMSNGRPELRVWCGNCGDPCAEHDEVRYDCFACEEHDALAADPIDAATRAALLRIGVEAVILWAPQESARSVQFDSTHGKASHV